MICSLGTFFSEGCVNNDDHSRAEEHMYNAYLEFKQQYEPHPSWFAPGVVLSPPLQDVEPDQQTEPCSGPQQYHLSRRGSCEKNVLIILGGLGEHIGRAKEGKGKDSEARHCEEQIWRSTHKCTIRARSGDLKGNEGVERPGEERGGSVYRNRQSAGNTDGPWV